MISLVIFTVLLVFLIELYNDFIQVYLYKKALSQIFSTFDRNFRKLLSKLMRNIHNFAKMFILFTLIIFEVLGHKFKPSVQEAMA